MKANVTYSRRVSRSFRTGDHNAFSDFNGRLSFDTLNGSRVYVNNYNIVLLFSSEEINGNINKINLGDKNIMILKCINIYGSRRQNGYNSIRDNIS